MMNTSYSTSRPNVTASAVSEQIPTYAKTLLYIAYCTVFVVGTIGNALVLYFRAYKYNGKKTSHDYQTISLAIADLLGSIFTPTAFIIDLAIELKPWQQMGTFGCKLFGTMDMFLTVTSAWMMTAIGITRLRTIRRVTCIHNTYDNIDLLLIAQAWIVGLTVTSPYTYFLDVTPSGRCSPLWNPSIAGFIWYCVLLAVWCILPVAILFVCSVVSYRALLNAWRMKVTSTRKDGNRDQQRVSRTFLIVIGTFFVLTTPYAWFYFRWIYLVAFQQEKLMQVYSTYRVINFVLTFVSSLNSVVNPLIYARVKIWKYLRCARKYTV